MVEKTDKIKEIFQMDEEELNEKLGGVAILLVKKSELYERITKLSNELIEAKNSEKSHLGDLWLCTIWDEVIEGRATDKTKGAYVNEHIRPFKAECENIQNKIDACWREVDLINDYFKIGGVND